MKKIILFDLGNTLVRYYERAEFPGILEQAIDGVQGYLREAGLLDVSTDSLWKRVEEENHESPDYAVRPMVKRLARIFQLDPEDDNLMMAVCRRFMEPVFALAYRYDDTLPVLEELGKMGVRKAIISNTPWGSPGSLWQEEIRRLGLDDQVEAVVFCGDVGWRKPDRRIFEFTFEKLQASPQDCVFVGDDPRWDRAGPEAVGMKAIIIDRRGTLQDNVEKPIKSLYELLEKY
jgi:putative hydrolase of the HAD superfamily